MEKDYDLWNIDEIVKAYTNAPDMAKNARLTMELLFFFLEESSLLKTPISENGKLKKRVIKKSDLTKEGLLLATGPKNPVHRWLGSKSSQKNPPDISPLSKALTALRAKA